MHNDDKYGDINTSEHDNIHCTSISVAFHWILKTTPQMTSFLVHVDMTNFTDCMIPQTSQTALGK